MHHHLACVNLFQLLPKFVFLGILTQHDITQLYSHWNEKIAGALQNLNNDVNHQSSFYSYTKLDNEGQENKYCTYCTHLVGHFL